MYVQYLTLKIFIQNNENFWYLTSNYALIKKKLKQSVKNCFIRGSVVRYVQLPADEVDTQLLQDAARKEATQNSNAKQPPPPQVA